MKKILQTQLEMIKRIKITLQVLIPFIICFILFSCDKTDKYLTSTWIVDSIRLDSVNYEKSIMTFNLMYLEENNKGSIPYLYEFDTISNHKSNYTNMKWEYFNSSNMDYIRIYDSQVDYFNDTFKVNIIDKKNVRFNL